MYKMPTNATLVERIMIYVEWEQPEKAACLATLGDHLEECFLWDVQFNEEG